MRTAVLALSFSLAFAGSIRSAPACSCMPPGSDEAETARSAAVFVGFETSSCSATREA